MPHYKARMSSKGRLTIPSAVREHFDLKPGDIVDFYIDDADHSVRILVSSKRVSSHVEDLDMHGEGYPATPGLNEAAAEYIAEPYGRMPRHSIFDRLDELKLPSIGRPVTRADIDAAISEAMEEQEQRIRNQRQR